MKRAYKLQEFVAHTSNVNCLQVGRKSAGVLVTGGEDKKVNVWAIGKPTAVLVRSINRSEPDAKANIVDCQMYDCCRACQVTRVLWSVSPLMLLRRWLWQAQQAAQSKFGTLSKPKVLASPFCRHTKSAIPSIA